jgi:hypothetical protein
MTRKKKVNPNEPVSETFSQLVSAPSAKDQPDRDLLARLAQIEAERDAALSRAKTSEARVLALEAVQRQGASGTAPTESPTGDTVKLRVFERYKVTGWRENGTAIREPVWKTEECPTYFYKIDLPPCGDTHISINGTNYYHGATYEFDARTLSTVKDLVYRCHAHDKSIHPGDENFYRRDAGWLARNARAIQTGRF